MKSVSHYCDNCGDEIQDYSVVENQVVFYDVRGNVEESYDTCDRCRGIVTALFSDESGGGSHE